MTKKKVIIATYIIILVLIVLTSYIQFATTISMKVDQGKSILILEKPDVLTNAEYIHTLTEISASLSSDIMFSRVSQENDFQYFKTNLDSEFLDLWTSHGSTLLEEGEFLSSDEGADGRIYGFVSEDYNIYVYGMDKLTDFDIDLSVGKFYVPDEKLTDWINAFDQSGIGCEVSNEVSIPVDKSFLFVVVLFVFFLFISVVFYSVSRAREYTIKKSMGYSNFDISAGEFKDNLKWSAPAAVVTLLLSFVGFGIAYDFISSTYFLLSMLPLFLIVFFLLQVTMLVSVYLIGRACHVQQIKGHNSNKGIFVFATVAKAIIFVILIVYISQVMNVFQSAYRQYSTVKETADAVNGFAVIPHTRVQGEDPSEKADKYVNRFLGFYQEMHDTKQAIIASMNQAVYENEGQFSMEDTPGQETAMSNRLPSVTINDNYLDFNQKITGLNGERITSADLIADKYNILIPASYDKEKILSIRAIQRNYGEEALHFIEYSQESEFFSFSTKGSTDQPGYLSNVIAYVYNPDVEVAHEDAEIVVGNLQGYFSGGFFFRYDTDMELTPFEQISSIIKSNGLSGIIVESPSVQNFYQQDLSSARVLVTILATILTVLIFSFVYLLLYSAEQYFLHYAKSISVKLLNGHSLLDICVVRIVFKISILVLLSIIGLFIRISFPLAIIAALFEVVVFYLVLKAHSQRNITSIIKGQV